MKQSHLIQIILHCSSDPCAGMMDFNLINYVKPVDKPHIQDYYYYGVLINLMGAIIINNKIVASKASVTRVSGSSAKDCYI
ncbi:hypothetical protein GDO78_003058 [Eleutherodactylus coqui]|uniref:Uncharacterized protein n=1 Tax=Eleutherodactylus coqui TaxID=57060 RepID=A0A8J6EVQ3_ELECQ|nr:hypothetical protein GDO78_003058 [Eleutherodactylus coqui]